MSRFADYLLPAASALGLPLVALPAPAPGRPVFVVASPWGGAADTIGLVARAEGRLLRGAGVPWVTIAVSDEPGFPTRLRDAGAWLAIDASWVSGCPKPGER